MNRRSGNGGRVSRTCSSGPGEAVVGVAIIANVVVASIQLELTGRQSGVIIGEPIAGDYFSNLEAIYQAVSPIGLRRGPDPPVVQHLRRGYCGVERPRCDHDVGTAIEPKLLRAARLSHLPQALVEYLLKLEALGVHGLRRLFTLF